MRGLRLVVFMLCLLCVAPVGAQAAARSGGASYAPPPPPPAPGVAVPGSQPTVPGAKAVLMPNGLAAAPQDAPPQRRAGPELPMS